MTHNTTLTNGNRSNNNRGVAGGSSSGASGSQSASGMSRPKPVFFWSNADVMKWLKRHCEDYYGLYGHLFLEHEMTGRSMVRMTDATLIRLGITDEKHRDDLLRIILKLKLKSDILEMKALEKNSGPDSSSSTMTHGISWIPNISWHTEWLYKCASCCLFMSDPLVVCIPVPLSRIQFDQDFLHQKTINV